MKRKDPARLITTLLEHLEHPIGDQESADNIDRGARDRDKSQDRAGRIVVGAVASAHAARTMSRECDAMVCLNVPLDFHAVGQFFDDFAQVSNREVIEILREVTRTFLQSGKSGEVAMRPDGAVEQSLVKRNSPTGKNPIANGLA